MGESGTAVSIREFARRIGVSETAVRKAIKSGRLKDFVAHVDGGKPAISDPEAAQKAWTASSRNAAYLSRTGSQQGSQGSHSPESSHAAPPAGAQRPPDGEPTQGDLIAEDTLLEAQKVVTKERARKLKLENDVSEGRLVQVEVVAKEAFEAERTIREAILNLPARLSGELAAETDAGRIYTRLDAALRECLTNVADELLATVNA